LNGCARINQTSEATDTMRLGWLRRRLEEAAFPPEAVAALLIADWAAKTPDWTAAFAADVTKWSERHSVTTQVDEYKKGWSQDNFRCFWSKHVGLNLRRFLTETPAVFIKEAAQMLVAGVGERRRFIRLQQKFRDLPFLGPYSSFAMLRAVGAALNLRFQDYTAAAANMSFHTSTLAKVLPMAKACANLRNFLPRAPDLMFTAWIYCEVTKILRHEAVLQPLEKYVNDPEATIQDLTSAKAVAVLKKARALVAVQSVPPEDCGPPEWTSDLLCIQPSNTDALKVWQMSCAQAVCCSVRKRSWCRGQVWHHP